MKKLLRVLVRLGALIAAVLLLVLLVIVCAVVLIGAAIQTVGEAIASVFHFLMTRDVWLASLEKIVEALRTGRVRK